jgi:hypothetical protein
MSALTDRQKAREKLSQVFQTILDKMIPPDNSVPLEGCKFIDFEDQGDELARTMVPLFLEERAALDAAAQADMGGRCPFCKSDRIYLIKEVGNVEVLTPHGPVVLKKQRGRCRECDRSFSPSRARLGDADRGGVVTQGGSASGS